MQNFNEESIIGKLFLVKWHPQPTIPCAIVIFLSLGIIFLTLGIVIQVFNSHTSEFKINQYNTLGTCDTKEFNNFCQFIINLPQIEGEVFLFYELTNFYQNHRQYVNSKNNNQLANKAISESVAQTYCDPVAYNDELYEYQQNFYIDKNNTYHQRQSPLPQRGIANPCGLIAKTYFNDTFSITNFITKQNINISENGITWSQDIGTRFIVLIFRLIQWTANPNISWIDIENEHFIVWMRTAGLNNFRKLWGRIPGGIQQGQYIITVMNNYNPSVYDGQKNLFFSNSSPFGGKNEFLGISFLVGGGLQLCVAIFFYLQSKYGNDNYGQKIE